MENMTSLGQLPEREGKGIQLVKCIDGHEIFHDICDVLCEIDGEKGPSNDSVVCYHINTDYYNEPWSKRIAQSQDARKLLNERLLSMGLQVGEKIHIWISW